MPRKMKPSILLLTVFLACSCPAQVDPAVAAHSELTNDLFAAGSFYDDVPHLVPAQDDEELRFAGDRELVFGYAQACRTQGTIQCRMVFVRPIVQIARHWLTLLQADWERLDRRWPKNTKEQVQYVADLKSAMQQPDSVWIKTTKLYCQLDPEGKYKDLDGMLVICSGTAHK